MHLDSPYLDGLLGLQLLAAALAWPPATLVLQATVLQGSTRVLTGRP